MRIVSDKNTKGIFIMSVLLALFADIKCVNSVLVAFNPSFEGSLMSILYAGTVFLILFAGIKNNSIFGLSIKNLIIPIYCLTLYSFTILFGYEPRVSFLIFGVFTLSAYVMPLVIQIDTRIMLKATMFFSIFSLAKLSTIFAFAYDYNAAISMGASYAYLVPVLATIVYDSYYLKFERGKQRLVTIILSLCNLVFLFELVLFGSRGPLLAIAVFILLFYIVKPGYDHGAIIKKSRLLVGSVLLFLLVIFFPSIVDILESLGIHSYSLTKIINMADEGTLSNGRDSLAEMAISGFFEKPLFGHGLDLFGVRYEDASYPHNFILQILYDGGIIFFLILIIPGIRLIKNLFRNCSYNQLVFFLFIFSVSVPGALFSGDLWESSLLWIMFGYLFNQNCVISKNEI